MALLCTLSIEWILTVSVLKLIHEELVLIYRLIQQPEFIPSPIYSVIINGSGEILIPAIHFAANIGQTVMSISYETPIGLASSSSNIEDQIMTSPEEGGPEMRTRLQERKENWIIRCLPRSTGNRSDLNYVHLKTDKQFRSLLAVYNFIVHGVLPERRRTKRGDVDNNPTASHARKIRGDKLLNRVRVGYYNHTTGQIVRTEVSPVQGSDEPTTVGIGNKRKRGGEISTREVLNADSGIPEHVYILYDFEPKE